MNHEPQAREEASVRLNQRVGAITVAEIETQARQLLEPAVTESLMHETRILRTQLTKARNQQEVEALFNAFFTNLERRSASESYYQFLYKAALLIGENRQLITSLLADNEQDGFLASYEQYIRTRELSANPQTPPKRGFFGALKSLGKNMLPAITNREAQARLALNTGIAAGSFGTSKLAEQNLEMPPGINEIFKLATGFVFAAYTIYIALLLSAAEGKATRGATNLESLAAALVSYANFAPETAQIVEQIITRLIEGIKTTGKFNVDDLIDMMEELTGTDRNDEVKSGRLDNLSDKLNGLREACRHGISPGIRKVIEGGGGITIFLSALSGSNGVESAVLSGISIAVVTAVQEVVYDLDKPWGEGSMTLSTEPLETALTRVKFAAREAELKDKLHKELSEREIVDDNIVESFYQCFMNILDNDADPEFLIGPEIIRQGTLDMDKQISFRHNDEPQRQLALLEATMEKIASSVEIQDDRRIKASAKLRGWINRVNYEKAALARSTGEGNTKSVEQEVNDAVEAIFGEISRNITTIGEAHYVLERKAGSQKIQTETASRKTDWEQANQSTRLDPIHTRVIAKLKNAMIENAENAAKYEGVIAEINTARREKGLVEINV